MCFYIIIAISRCFVNKLYYYSANVRDYFSAIWVFNVTLTFKSESNKVLKGMCLCVHECINRK